MNIFFLNLLFSFQVLLPVDGGVNLTNSKQTVDVILPNLSLFGYAVPIEGLGIGLFICLLAYLAAEYNVRLQSSEKLKIAMNMLHSIHTPLILLRNQLEDIKTSGLPESISSKIEKVLGYTECIIDCNQNVIMLDKADNSIRPKTSTANLELSAYITSIVNQCRAYANTRQVRLTVNECPDCVSCRINENIMTAALQHLLNKIILITDSGCCISINVTHTTNAWELHISNNVLSEKKEESLFSFISTQFFVYSYGDLRTVRKIIRSHGGKMTGYGHGKTVTFRIVIPTDCHCRNKSCPVINHPTTAAMGNLDKSSRIINREKEYSKAKDAPHILLVMTDNMFSSYLKKSLSKYYQISILENPDLLVQTVTQQIPDTIIIDDNVNGISGDSLCFQIKTDKMIGEIPVVLLIRSFDNESYLSHLGSGADRLKLRTESICKFRADIQMLIENRMILRERIKLFLSDAIFPLVPIKQETKNPDLLFMDRVNEILEKNLSTEKYTIDKLSADIGMSRTAFYGKMKEILGKSPEDYIYSFKMDKALKLLASQQFSISEIAGMLGYCDAQYFRKKFKDFYHVCPTDYIKSIIG
ncbi:helix-turn-helix domain-containing protein [Bacteroides faecium]|uniref:Helix-turn-helix domain-containing protein n=1 Tax=Bacteroides faecium TaxID=2715212 RepID=A0A6H0KTN0_9BACE|nr:helix-turn-helix domain-containing protein [Bacteroides faecium]QIU95838.1 helix-turn-helix domain-containing protein [Bacteroides faecium]